VEIKDSWHFSNVILKIANKWLHKPEADKELSYLLKRIPSISYVDKFMFGYFPSSSDSIVEFMDEFSMLTKEDPLSIFKNLGFVYPYYSRYKSFFRTNTLLIPFYDIYGNVISFSGRTIVDEETQRENNISKYKHLSFKKRYHVFGLNDSFKHIINNDKVIIVEGQFDFYSSFISGMKNCVALCCSKLTFQQISLLKRFTNNFYLLLDEDEAGLSGLKKAEIQSKKYNFNLFKLKIPDSKDIDEFIKSSNWKISLDQLMNY